MRVDAYTIIEALTYLFVAFSIFILAFKININEIFKSIFYNKMSLNRLIVVALTFIVFLSMIMKETQTTSVALGGLIAFLQLSKKDGKNGGTK
jgi:hypothetical protein